MDDAETERVRAELEEQRCLIEQQQVEINRQQHQIKTQRERLNVLEAEVEAIKVALRPAASNRQATQGKAGNGNGRHSSRHLGSEGNASSGPRAGE